MQQLINTTAKLNPAIVTFISSKIYDWRNFSDYHCNKQKELYPERVYCSNLSFEVLALSIGRLLQLKEQRIIYLLNKQTATDKYSQMDIWMLKTIKKNVFSVYSARSKRRIM